MKKLLETIAKYRRNVNRLPAFSLLVTLLLCQFGYAEQQISQFGISGSFEQECQIGQLTDDYFKSAKVLVAIDSSKSTDARTTNILSKQKDAASAPNRREHISKPRVTLTKNGGFLVDGEPYLPIWVWNQPSSLITFHKDLGINTLKPGHPEKTDPIKRYLDKAHKAGMMVVASASQCSRVKGHPAILMYMVGHEDDKGVTGWYSLVIDDPSTTIWIEGEEPKESTFPKRTWINTGEPISLLSNGRWLTAAKKGDWRATDEFEVTKSGTYRLWAREFNKSWANPTTWCIDEREWQTTPRALRSKEVKNFRNGRGVGWCTYGTMDLTSGIHELRIKVTPGRTCGNDGKVADTVIAGYDGFAFTMAETYPAGKKGEMRPRRLPHHQKTSDEAVKACDPDALTFVIFTAQFFGRYRKIDLKWYHDFSQYADVIGFDHYPVTGWNKPERVPEVGLATKLLAELARPNQPVITFIESSDQELSWTREGFRGPTPEEMRCEAFQAIANGAKGIGHFTIAFGRGKKFKWVNLTEEMKKELRRTNGQLTRLTAPIVLGKDLSRELIVTSDETNDKQAEGNAVQAIRKDYEGTTYIIAVNVTRQPVSPTFVLEPRLKAKEAIVFEEDRKISIRNGNFSDTFEPLAVHIYVIESNVINKKMPKAYDEIVDAN